MVFVTNRARMGVRYPWGEQATPPRASAPAGLITSGIAALFCAALWATSTEVLLASELREGGRVLACRYFTGARVTERQHLNSGHSADQRACPVVRVD